MRGNVRNGAPEQGPWLKGGKDRKRERETLAHTKGTSWKETRRKRERERRRELVGFIGAGLINSTAKLTLILTAVLGNSRTIPIARDWRDLPALDIGRRWHCSSSSSEISESPRARRAEREEQERLSLPA